MRRARAGNVIGGGDWADDRLLPDCMRALAAGEAIAIRNPHAVRPWQHVLDPLCGYLLLAERLAGDPADFGDAWNFGPADDDARPVAWIARTDRGSSGATALAGSTPAPMHRTRRTLLKVDASKARRASRLGAAIAARRGAGVDGRLASAPRRRRAAHAR